jgi:acetyltransferase
MNARLPESVGAEVERLLAALPVIRPLRAHDRDLVDSLVRELSPTSRYRRFHAPVNELSPALLDRLARVDVPGEVAYLATTTARGRETAVGEARFAVDVDGHDGREFALVVTESWQRLGVGTRLLRELIREAEKTGVRHLYGDTFADNAPMLALAHRLGFERRRHPTDARLVRLSWTPGTSIVDRVVAVERRRTPGPLLT